MHDKQLCINFSKFFVKIMDTIGLLYRSKIIACYYSQVSKLFRVRHGKESRTRSAHKTALCVWSTQTYHNATSWRIHSEEEMIVS